ncbi:hypothetical protein MMC18_000281 [Xylographa bjoerkii]|nr:hypothetical protein [Xylographa bjoerkii]
MSSSDSPTRKLIALLQQQLELEEEHEGQVDYITAETVRDAVATVRVRVRLLEIHDELGELARQKAAWRARDTRSVQKRVRKGEAAYAYSAR